MKFRSFICAIVFVLCQYGCDTSDAIENRGMSLKKQIPLSYTSNEDTCFILPFVSDTVNRKDQNGLRQGYWHINNHEGVQQDGIYSNNKRQGIWTFTFTNINLSQTTFTVFYRNDTMQKVN